MCGIAGALHFDGSEVHPRVLARMTARLRHRGPDDFGHVQFDGRGVATAWKEQTPSHGGRLGLGNRRLRILDLSAAGHQPMSAGDGRVWITFNGEIYNYVELRDELKKAGHRFETHTDTEVVLQAYLAWGVSCFARFNGMWGMAIYDVRERELILARDRWGVKPLYVFRSSTRIVFGSEIKALLEHPDVPRKPNYRTVFNYAARHYRWVDGGRDSFFEGIDHLPPAHYWRISDSGDVVEQRYWGLEPGSDTGERRDDDVLEEFRDIFFDAVRVRLRADVPVACMLSGGLDSSSVTCAAAQLSSNHVTTFSARYHEADFDEGPYIEATVAHTSAEGRFIWPRASSLIDTLETMLQFHDEPVCTVTWFAHWLVMREVASMGFPVLLNGHVGDELFAGYWNHYPYHFADLERQDPAAFEREYALWMSNHRRDPQEYSRFRTQLSALEEGLLGPADPLTQYADSMAPELRAMYSGVPSRPNPFAGRGYLIERLYQEIAYETVPATLRPEDRNSMAFSIETRSPFLDYRLAEFAFALPSRFKIRDGLGKWIIREGMAGILPDSVRTRRDKQGFNAPTVHWYRSESGDAVRDVLASSSLADRGLLDQQRVLQYFDEHVAGTANHYMAIWQWLNLELWMRDNFDHTARP